MYSFAPNIIGDPNLPRGQRTPDRWFNTSVVRPIDPNGPIGNAPRNNLRAPGMNNWDFGIFKKFPISERWGYFEFRAEFFNAFNHPIFDFPDSLVGDASFGSITSAQEARNIQFAVKYYW
jgi:hypothetical protein